MVLQEEVEVTGVDKGQTTDPGSSRLDRIGRHPLGKHPKIVGYQEVQEDRR